MFEITFGAGRQHKRRHLPPELWLQILLCTVISYVGRRAVSDIALELWCDITFRKSNVHIANILLKLQNPAHLPESEVLFLVNFQYE